MKRRIAAHAGMLLALLACTAMTCAGNFYSMADAPAEGGAAIRKPPVIRNVAPREGEVIAGRQAAISGSFDDTGGIDIDPRTVHIKVAGNEVTAAATVTPQFFRYRTDLQPGPYPVEVLARDVEGHIVRHHWTFTVAPEMPAAQAALPLEVISHDNHAAVAQAPVRIKGRTAPGAQVEAVVQAFPKPAGAQEPPPQSQSLLADDAGNFAFAFTPAAAAPGTRYEVDIQAAKHDLRRATKLVLYQR